MRENGGENETKWETKLRENRSKCIKVGRKWEKMGEVKVGRKPKKMGENLSKLGENERKREKSWEKIRENGRKFI